VDDEAGIDSHLRAAGPIRPHDGGIAVSADVIAAVEHQQIGVVT